VSTTPPRRKMKFLTEGSPKELLEELREANDMLELGDPKLGELSRRVLERVPPAERASLRRVGKGTWRIQFAESDVRIRHLVGLWRYALLLGRPGEEIEATELEQLTRDAAACDGVPTEIEELGLDTRSGRRRRKKVDEKTREALDWTWNRIRELKAKMQHERDFGSKEQAARIMEEIEKLAKTVNVVSYRGRERDDSAPAEKARKAVVDSFATARRRIEEKIPKLAEYLDECVSPRGTRFIFWRPDGDPGWEIETDF